MALITIPFNFDINVSVAVGDTAYVADVTSTVTGQSATHRHSQQGDIIEIGEVIQVEPTINTTAGINQSFIVVDDTTTGFSLTIGALTAGDFVMFSKDNKVNLSSLAGYYALTKIKNNSTEKAELFSIAADFVESSK